MDSYYELEYQHQREGWQPWVGGRLNGGGIPPRFANKSDAEDTARELTKRYAPLNQYQIVYITREVLFNSGIE